RGLAPKQRIGHYASARHTESSADESQRPHALHVACKSYGDRAIDRTWCVRTSPRNSGRAYTFDTGQPGYPAGDARYNQVDKDAEIEHHGIVAADSVRASHIVLNFLSELKRRNVVKVGIAYAATGWILVEVASVLFPIFKAPEWVLQVFATLIVLGFPFALAIAWAFDLTPEGLKRTVDVAPSESNRRETGRRLDFLIIGVLALAVLLFSLDKFFWNDEEAAPATADGRSSIAVLPFANRSVLEEDAYFADGMHDELLAQLSKIGSLKVISRTSVLRYRDTDLSLPEIADQLGVATILEGAVQRAAGQVRITVQLIDAQRDEHLWADTYDRALNTGNLFAIQSDITREITQALEAALTSEERARIGNAPTDSLQAYQYYLKGRQALPLRTADALKEGRSYAERSLALDPQFAPALALLADSLHLLHEYTGLPVEESLKPAMDLVKKALAIDPNLAEGYAVLGELHRHEGNVDEAAAAFQQAIRLAPGDAQAYNWFSILREDEGRFEEQLELLQRAHELNPMVALIHQNLAWALFQVGRDEEALAEYRLATELHPTFALGWLKKSWMHSRRGELLEGLRDLRRYQQLEPAAWENVYICRVLSDLDAPELAESCYSGWVGAFPQDARVLLVSGYRYAARGDIAEARRIIRQADALDDPDWPSWVAKEWPYWIADEAVKVADYELAGRVLSEQEPHWLSASQPHIEVHWRQGPIAAAALMVNDGDVQRAQTLLRAIAVQIEERQRARGGNAYGYEDVTLYALLGDKERALSNLEDVATTGYLTDWHALRYMPQLALLRDEPRFDEAIALLRSKAHHDREQARREGLLDAP
ncbi:MAG TPA: tetratricopeptide repeat protein, partial [Burkholderiales bacterium]|nr:tetratricopeptide repeat protein [Burkholderiales bacterium]